MCEPTNGTFQRISAIMESLHFRYIRPPAERYQPTDSDLAAFEKALSRNLPEDYRTFLSHFGIIAFDDDITFPLSEAQGHEDWLWVFYGYAPTDIYHIQGKWDSTRRSWGVPDHFLPIARTDATGAQIFLSLDASDFGSLYYIDRETFWDFRDAYDERKADFLDYAIRINTSFMRFLESLRGEDPVNQAVRWGSAQDLTLLLEQGRRADLPDSLGHFPCENAVGPGMGIEKLRMLIEAGAPPKLALINAARSYDRPAMELLLEHGVDVNAWEANRFNGCTALHQAISYKRADSVRFLLRHGANPALSAGRGLTGLELAQLMNNEEIVALLRDGTGAPS